jgi:hypothetical protein
MFSLTSCLGVRPGTFLLESTIDNSGNVVDKYPSFIEILVNYGHKKFITLVPGGWIHGGDRFLTLRGSFELTRMKPLGVTL